MHDIFVSGNGNGNKMNLRVEILENLLNASGDGTSAKINSLKQAIRRNKSDMADNTTKSLDVFQHEMTEEIKQIIDRHLRTNFAPAFENLKSNGHDVSQDDIDSLCVSILDGAKRPFLKEPELENTSNICIPSFSVLKNFGSKSNSAALQMENNNRVYESDDNESDGSIISHNSVLSGHLNGERFNRPKKRGRPRKTEAELNETSTPTPHNNLAIGNTNCIIINCFLAPQGLSFNVMEASKWNPERIDLETRFILGSKVNKALSTVTRTHIFNKYSKVLRYVADDVDKAWLFNRGITTRITGKVIFMILEDAIEIAKLENASLQIQNEIQRNSFYLHVKLIEKIKLAMQKPYDLLQLKVSS